MDKMVIFTFHDGTVGRVVGPMEHEAAVRQALIISRTDDGEHGEEAEAELEDSGTLETPNGRVTVAMTESPLQDD